jgi:hypothetical protein
MEKARGGCFGLTTPKTAEDEGRRRGRGGLGHDTVHIPVETPSLVLERLRGTAVQTPGPFGSNTGTNRDKVPETWKPGRLCNGVKPPAIQTDEAAKFSLNDCRIGTVWATRGVDAQT